MRFLTFAKNGVIGLAAHSADGWHGLLESEAGYPGPLESLLARSAAELSGVVRRLRAGAAVDPDAVETLIPFVPRKIICVGLNYMDHASESSMKAPDYPTFFARFRSSLVAHSAPILRPHESDRLDYEGELVAVISKAGRRIERALALDHVGGYSVFNDGSIRDFQLRTPQWTFGKNFDGTGAFGPTYVTADELPPGAAGLQLQTRLNGQVVQTASTSELIFDVAALVSMISVGITLEPGDIIVTGTPSGVGAARKPPLFMKAGDECEVEIERIGVLRNEIIDDVAVS